MATTAGSLSTPLPPHADTPRRAILDRVAATPDKLAFTSPGPDDAGQSSTPGARPATR